MYKQFSKGEQVINRYGSRLEVVEQRERQVFVKGSTAWYHPSNLYKVADKAKANDPQVQ